MVVYVCRQNCGFDGLVPRRCVVGVGDCGVCVVFSVVGASGVAGGVLFSMVGASGVAGCFMCGLAMMPDAMCGC